MKGLELVMKIKVAYFEILNICNLNCQTCYNSSGFDGEHKEKREISVLQLRQAIETLLPLGLNRVLLSGGEPLLHTDFNGVLGLVNDYLRLVEKYPTLSFGIVTNGTVHNQKLIDMLNTNDRFTLQISLDGSCEEQNAKIRGAGNFKKTIEFAKQIKKKNPKPLLKMVITKDSINDVEPFYRLAVSLGFMPEFAFIYKSGNACEDWKNKALSAQQKLHVLRLMDKLNNELNVKPFMPLCTNTCPYVEDTDSMSVCIKTNGTIQPCQALYDDAHSIGNIFDFNLSNFENKVKSFAELAKKRTQQDYGCLKCPLKTNCGKGCLAEAVNLHGNPLGNDMGCEFRKMQLWGYDLKEALSQRKSRTIL